MNVITAGIYLANNPFAVHDVDDNGKPALVKPKVARADLSPLIGMDELYPLAFEQLRTRS